MKIIKFTMEEKDTNTFDVPDDFTPIHLELQGERVVVWGETYFENPREAPQRPMTFFTVGTGWNVKRDTVRSHYVGTAILYGGGIVWHYYWSWLPDAIKYPERPWS
jgi:hypothetical protein